MRTWLVEGATSVLLFPLAVVARTHDAMATHDPAVQSTGASPLPKRRDRRPGAQNGWRRLGTRA